MIAVLTDMYTSSLARTHPLALSPSGPEFGSGPIVLFFLAYGLDACAVEASVATQEFEKIASLHYAMLPRSGCCMYCKHVVPSPRACQSHPLSSASF